MLLWKPAPSHDWGGVTMGDDGVSKLLSIKLEEASAVVKT